MRYLILFLLLSTQASAQALLEDSSNANTADYSTESGHSLTCDSAYSTQVLGGTELAFTSHYRATTTTNTVPGFQCDAVLDRCVKFGPGSNTSVGVNTLGEVVFGIVGLTTGIWRFWGTVYASLFSATNVTGTNSVTYGTVLDQGINGFMRNPNNKPVLVDNTQGFQNKCKANLTTCGSTAAPEGTELKVCGTGGAKTRKCECLYDGTTYTWFNVYNPSAGVGTTTSCPAT